MGTNALYILHGKSGGHLFTAIAATKAVSLFPHFLIHFVQHLMQMFGWIVFKLCNKGSEYFFIEPYFLFERTEIYFHAGTKLAKYYSLQFLIHLWKRKLF